MGDTPALARLHHGLDRADAGGRLRGNDARQWHTLIDKVFSPKTLALALASVTKRDRAAGVDGITTQAMRQREAEELPVVERLLSEDRYEPQPVRRVWIEKPGSREKRQLGIPTVRDRIVQQALRAVIEPIFERDFSDQSYGFRPGRSARAAVARVEEQLEAGKTWVVDAKGWEMTRYADYFIIQCESGTSAKAGATVGTTTGIQMPGSLSGGWSS